MDKDKALVIWNHEFGDKEYAYDFAGRKIKRDDYLEGNQVGWVVTYMRPLSSGGTTDTGNIIIMHHRSADEKGISYPQFIVDGSDFIVKHEKKGDYYYIEKVLDIDDEDDDYYETDEE